MRVHISEQARTELFEIGAWIERDSPVRAQSFVEELFDACMHLGKMPNAFALVPGLRNSGIRRRVYGNYSIFYTVGEHVHVLHVLYGARDFKSVLFPPRR